MHTDYLAIGENVHVASAMPVVIVTAPMGKQIYSHMQRSSAGIASFPIGSRLEIMGVMEDWLFVRAGEVVGFTENSGTVPRVYFSSPEATPAMRISLLDTSASTPTPFS